MMRELTRAVLAIFAALAVAALLIAAMPDDMSDQAASRPIDRSAP